MEREGLLDRGRELQDELAMELRPLASHELVSEVRCGTGALAGVAFSADALAEREDLVSRVAAQARERGVFVRPLADCIAVSPPLTISREEVELLTGVVAEALDAVTRQPAAV